MQSQDIQNTKEITNTQQDIEVLVQENLQDEVNALNNIEPAAGKEEQQAPNPQTQDTLLGSANFQPQINELAQTITIDTSGALDETELEYTLNMASLRTIATRTPIDQPDAPRAPQTLNRDRTPAEERAQTTIRLSNETTNQNTINDTDSYEINRQSGKNVKLYGDDMDINTVTESARVDYKFKTEDSFRANLKSGWNSIKNISVESDEIDTVTLKNFVHSDVSLYGNDDTKIKIINAKRGDIETENGNDLVIIKALTNGAGWSNTFDIDTGAGNDRVNAKGGDGHTIFEINTGSQNDTVRIRGDYDHAEINVSSGDDRVRGGNGNDIIMGGEGDDILFGGNDTDIAIFMGSIDEYTITKRGGKYLVEDSLEGRDGTDTLKGIEGLIFGIEDLIATAPNTQNNAQTTETLDLSELLDTNDTLQSAIDDFIHQANQGQATSTSIQSDIPTLNIFSIQDAVVETQIDII